MPLDVLILISGPSMPLFFKKFLERELLPKKQYAIFEHPDCRWWLTLTIHFNHEAKRAGLACVKNTIYASDHYREPALRELFDRFVNFHALQLFDDTITRVQLLTKVSDEIKPANIVSVTDALHYPLPSYMGVPLDNLVCIVDEDKTSAIPYTPLTLDSECPNLPLVNYEDVSRIKGSKGKLGRGACKVTVQDQNEVLVYKEPKLPDDVQS